MKPLALLIILLAVSSCATPPAPGWTDASQDNVMTVARAVADNPAMALLVFDTDRVYTQVRNLFDRQESAALTAQWFRVAKAEDLVLLRTLFPGVSDADLIVGVIVAGGMNK